MKISLIKRGPDLSGVIQFDLSFELFVSYNVFKPNKNHF